LSTTRLKGSVILTFSTGLKSVNNVKARVALAKSSLGNVKWHELKAISHEHVGKGVPSFIIRFMKHNSIVIPINLKIIKLLRCKFTYLVIGDAYQATHLTTMSVIDGITGILMRPYLFQAFANTIIKVRELWLSNRQKYERMSILARRNAERFCWEGVVKIYYEKFFKQG